MKHLLATAALALVLPVAANAAVINAVGGGVNNDIGVDDLVLGGVVLSPGDSDTWKFTNAATSAIKVQAVAYTLNGFSQGDLLNVDFGVNAADQNLIPAEIVSGGGVFAGERIQTVNLTLAPGEMFTILVNDGLTDEVDFDFTFRTSVVPVPAAGLLLGTVLLGGGLLARRKAA